MTAAKFETFAHEWFKDYAELKLKRNTVTSYHNREKRLYAALGHIHNEQIPDMFIEGLLRDFTDKDKQFLIEIISAMKSYKKIGQIMPSPPLSGD